jgi:hypothetical protein
MSRVGDEMKYELICPDCGGDSFCRIYDNTTLFEDIDPDFDTKENEFSTTYNIERQFNTNTIGTIKCNDCEFEVEIKISAREHEQFVTEHFMKRLIEEKCAVEVGE